MKKPRISETQVVKILKESEAGVAVDQLSRRHGFSKSTFYKWKAKYGGLDVSQLKRLKELEGRRIIDRRVFAEVPVRVEYTLTDKGKALSGVIEAMVDWDTNVLG